MWKVLFILILFLVGCIKNEERDVPINEIYCVKMGTNENMSLEEAQNVAMTECDGFVGDFVCNKFLGAWIINLEQHDNCNPACVIDVVTQRVHIDANCTQ